VLDKAYKVSVIAGGCMFVALLILWPIPMHGSHYVFSEKFYTFWVFIAMLWGFVAALIIIFMPIIESLEELRGVFAVLCGGAKPPTPTGGEEPPAADGSVFEKSFDGKGKETDQPTVEVKPPAANSEPFPDTGATEQ